MYNEMLAVREVPTEGGSMEKSELRQWAPQTRKVAAAHFRGL
jgi:hypothetical protein